MIDTAYLDKFYDEHPGHAYEKTTRHGPYMIAELRAAFDRVANPQDWKAPIDAWVTEDLVDIVCAGVAFFTATEVETTQTEGDPVVRVQAAGYRMGPAGP